MDNLEDIAFRRICQFLSKFHIEVRIIDNYILLFLNNHMIGNIAWESKYDMLFGINVYSNVVLRFENNSIFKISQRRHFYLSANIIMRYGETELAELWPILRQFQADSPEEMLIKMDLIGI